MSFYSTLSGSIQYKDQESFNEILMRLETGGWVVKDRFVGECGTIITEDYPNIDYDNLVINIPYFHYRNLSRLDFSQGATDINIIGTSTDGCFDGWVINNGGEKNYDLEKWAIENLEDIDKYPPHKNDFSSEDDYWQNMLEWQQMVENEFISDNS